MTKQTTKEPEKKQYPYDENVIMFIFIKKDDSGRERITCGKYDEKGVFRFAQKDGLPIRVYRVNDSGFVIKKQSVTDIPVYDIE